jgi:hypothetical protein
VVLIHGAMVLTKSRGFEGDEYYLNGKLWRGPMGTEVNPTFVATSVDHIGFHTRKPSGHFVRDDGKTMEALEPGVPFRGVPYVRWYRDTGKAKNFLIDFLTWGLFGFTGSDSFIPNADGKGFFMNYFDFPGVCVTGQFEGDPLLGRQKLFSIQANGHEIVRLSGAKRSTQGPVASIPIGRHALRMVVKDSYEKDNSTRYLFRCFELTW